MPDFVRSCRVHESSLEIPVENDNRFFQELRLIEQHRYTELVFQYHANKPEWCLQRVIFPIANTL